MRSGVDEHHDHARECQPREEADAPFQDWVAEAQPVPANEGARAVGLRGGELRGHALTQCLRRDWNGQGWSEGRRRPEQAAPRWMEPIYLYMALTMGIPFQVIVAMLWSAACFRASGSAA